MSRHKGKVPFEEWTKTFQAIAKECKETARATGLRGKAFLQEYRKCMKERLKPAYEELARKYTA